MKVWLVREYMDGSNWSDARRVVGADPHEAAETFAKWQCNQDSTSYRAYESGKQLELKLYAANQSDAAAASAPQQSGSTLVSVWVSFDPHFSSRVERELKDCAHIEARLAGAMTPAPSGEPPTLNQVAHPAIAGTQRLDNDGNAIRDAFDNMPRCYGGTGKVTEGRSLAPGEEETVTGDDNGQPAPTIPQD